MAWKDSVNLTPKSKIKIVWMPDDRPGTWMYHCHKLEHHAAGMMATFIVIESNKQNDGKRSNQTHHIARADLKTTMAIPQVVFTL